MAGDPTLLLTHENRISNLEASQSEAKSDIAVLVERVDAGFELLVVKVDEFKSELIKHASEDKITAAKVDRISEQLAAIEGKKKLRHDRWSNFGKYVWMIVMAVIGAAFKFFFDRLKH